jgi:hypothetical protein
VPCAVCRVPCAVSAVCRNICRYDAGAKELTSGVKCKVKRKGVCKPGLELTIA